MAGLPPPPIQDWQGIPYSFTEWFRQLRRQVAGGAGGLIAWSDIDKSTSNLTDLVTRNHNDLQNIQGGTSGEFYHLTSSQNAVLAGYVNVSATGQNANIGATTLVTPSARGTYEVSVYHLCTTASAAGTLATTIGYTDFLGATTVKPAADLSLAGTGRATGSTFIQAESGVAITYSTTLTGVVGSPVYALFINLRRLS